MQVCWLYLYPNHLDIHVNLDSWVTERYRKVYNRNLKLYRGLDNKIEFRVKSSDQKFKNIGNSTFIINIINKETKKLILSKNIITQNAETGKLYIVLSSREILNIEPGQYNYAVYTENRTTIDSVVHSVNEKLPVYLDAQYGIFGELEVLDDVFGEPYRSTEISEFKFNTQYNQSDDFYLSGIIYANNQLVTAQSLHTFQMFFNDYTGRVIIQGSLDQGGNPHIWSDLSITDYINVDKEYINIVGKYNFFRIKHIPNEPGLIGSFSISQTIFGYYEVNIVHSGRGYAVGNQITVKGNTLGGSTPSNDLLITVTGVNDQGGIVAMVYSGRSYNGTQNFIKGNAAQTNTGTFDKILYR